MTRLLLDANLSPETRQHLVDTFGFDVVDLITERKAALSDADVVAFAKAQQRVIVTFDLDFGEIYHFAEKGHVGAIVLRLEDQTVEAVNRVLDAFFANAARGVVLHKSLVILDEHRARIISA